MTDASSTLLSRLEEDNNEIDTIMSGSEHDEVGEQ